MLEYESYINTHGNITAVEILRQPDVWRSTVKGLEELLKNTKIEEMNNLRICLTGAGSSGYCAEFVSAAINKYRNFHSEALHTTDIVGNPDMVLWKSVPTLLVSLARSGNSPESIGAVKYAREMIDELYEISISCDKESNLYRLTQKNADAVTVTVDACDDGFAMTSSFTGMAVAAYGMFSNKCFSSFSEEIMALCEVIERELPYMCDQASKIVEEYDFSRVSFLGSGVLKGIAREAGLKICELTKGIINIACDTSLGFRHGLKSVINDDCLSIHMISEDELTRKYDVDLANELIFQKGGNKILVVGEHKHDGADYSIAFNDSFTSDFGLGLACVVFCQLLAFYKSQKIGLPTDNPCPNGELNRVVKGVTVYNLLSGGSR